MSDPTKTTATIETIASGMGPLFGVRLNVPGIGVFRHNATTSKAKAEAIARSCFDLDSFALSRLLCDVRRWHQVSKEGAS